MSLITKDYTTDAVLRYNAELQARQLDEQSLLNPNVHPGLSGNKLWKMVRDIKVIPHLWDLKHQMYDEQGGLCCYCGLRIFKDSEAGNCQLSTSLLKVLIGNLLVNTRICYFHVALPKMM